MELKSYVAEDDSLILEDEYGRIKLTGAGDTLNVKALMSGLNILCEHSAANECLT